MLFLTLHGCLYYLYWILKGNFWSYALDWGTQDSIAYLAGGISLIAGWVLWATSIEWCRRRFFEVFYRCHLICFTLFVLFGYLHFYWAWSYFLPGLLLYAGDLVMRCGQFGSVTAAGVVPPTSGKNIEDASVVTLDIQASKVSLS
jgi:ferric-chelate reductase